MPHAGRSRVNDLFAIDLILPVALVPGVYSASNRNQGEGVFPSTQL
jgi:hypothetical protein